MSTLLFPFWKIKIRNDVYFLKKGLHVYKKQVYKKNEAEARNPHHYKKRTKGSKIAKFERTYFLNEPIDYNILTDSFSLYFNS